MKPEDVNKMSQDNFFSLLKSEAQPSLDKRALRVTKPKTLKKDTESSTNTWSVFDDYYLSHKKNLVGLKVTCILF